MRILKVTSCPCKSYHCSLNFSVDLKILPMRKAALFAVILASCASAADWPDWRGPRRDGISSEKNLPAKWSPAGENLAWKAPYGGRSAPIVMGDRVYILNNGHVVHEGQFVGRSEVVQGGTSGAEYEINWRVDRIRDTDIVLVREDPANPDVPTATRVIPLRPDDVLAAQQ